MLQKSVRRRSFEQKLVFLMQFWLKVVVDLVSAFTFAVCEKVLDDHELVTYSREAIDAGSRSGSFSKCLVTVP